MSLGARGAFWRRLAPCLVESWPSELTRLAGAQTLVPLSRPEMHDLLAAVRGTGAGAPVPRIAAASGGPSERLRALRLRLDAAISGANGHAFVRLGAASAKDGWRHQRTEGCARSGRDALEILTWGSRRIEQMLRLCLHAGHETTIVLRPFRPPPRSEYRLFVADGTLLGACQIGPPPAPPDPIVLARALRDSAGRIAAAVRAPSVADVFVEPGPKVTLFDVNPFSPRTDAAPFRWSGGGGGDFDGSIRLSDGSRI